MSACPRCQYDAADGDQVCLRCGQKLRAPGGFSWEEHAADPPVPDERTSFDRFFFSVAKFYAVVMGCISLAIVTLFVGGPGLSRLCWDVAKVVAGVMWETVSIGTP
ncbi:MAG: hypothetical protein H6684_00830 [Deltaproteobacteria bacterium]|nr:hypothetical protein [bacterium]MCB9478194.1 hypothetical protein [Deltaproteobacteria bacterium]MCB9487254.1 hypothetical protein [Deltaproteobacteria bacterium]